MSFIMVSKKLRPIFFRPKRHFHSFTNISIIWKDAENEDYAMKETLTMISMMRDMKRITEH